MIEVTVRLDESAIQTAAEEAWKRLLAPDDYRGHGGGAYQAVVRAAKDYIGTMDLRPLLAAAMQKHLQSTVDEVVQEHLRVALKKRLKSMPAVEVFGADSTPQAKEQAC